MVVLHEPYCPKCGRHYDWIDTRRGHCMWCRERDRWLSREAIRRVIKKALEDTHG